MISWQKQQHITSGLMPSGRTATREIKLRGISYKNEIQISLLISWHYHLFILMNFSIKRLSPLIKGGTMLFRIPNRFAQAYITKISNQVQAVADACALGDYEFRCQDYTATIAEASACGLLYCDPPYIDRHTDYFNGWDEEHERQLSKLLSDTKARFILSTWHSNEFRTNKFIGTIWTDYNILTREHFYHVGAKEDNRNPMLEALITNFGASYEEKKSPAIAQLTLFEKRAAYNG